MVVLTPHSEEVVVLSMWSLHVSFLPKICLIMLTGDFKPGVGKRFNSWATKGSKNSTEGPEQEQIFICIKTVSFVLI